MAAATDEPTESPTPAPEWSVYVLRCRDGALYTGIATDVARRLEQHAGDEGRGAKALRGRGPLELVLTHVIGERGPAQRVEARIKRLTKARKERLLADGGLIEHVLGSLAADGLSLDGVGDKTKGGKGEPPAR